MLTIILCCYILLILVYEPHKLSKVRVAVLFNSLQFMVLIQFGNSELGITMSGLVVFILAMVYKYLILVDPKVNSEINKLKEVIASRDLEIDNLKNQLSDKLAPQPLKGNTKELLEQVALLQNYIRSME